MRVAIRIPRIWQNDSPEAIARRAARQQELADPALEDEWRRRVEKNIKRRQLARALRRTA
jgi:tRNA U34 5-methylaminomethyl-2-thiouridine-forming methyltransferase MnmC